MKQRSSRLLAIAFLLIGGILVGQWSKTTMGLFVNIAVSRWLQGWQSDWLIRTSFFVSLFEFGEIVVIIPLAYRLWRKNRRKAAIVLVIAGLSWFPVWMLKQVFNVACPDPQTIKAIFPFHQLTDFLVGKAGASVATREVCYPSGHVFSYVSAWGMMYFLRKEIWTGQTVQKLVTVSAVVFISLVGFSRIALGAHYLTDVIGGYVLGGAWLIGLVYVYRYNKVR